MVFFWEYSRAAEADTQRSTEFYRVSPKLSLWNPVLLYVSLSMRWRDLEKTVLVKTLHNPAAPNHVVTFVKDGCLTGRNG